MQKKGNIGLYLRFLRYTIPYWHLGVAASACLVVSGFLGGNSSAADFAAEFSAAADQFGPCNLLVWDGAELHYASTGAASSQIEPGIHALGNAPLGANWPRVLRAEQGLRDALDAGNPEAGIGQEACGAGILIDNR